MIAQMSQIPPQFLQFNSIDTSDYLKIINSLDNDILRYKISLGLDPDIPPENLPNITNYESSNNNEIENLNKVIEDLKYENSLLTHKNQELKLNLDSLTFKYNNTQKDLNNLNKQINLCQQNQDQAFSRLKERNLFLENLVQKIQAEKLNNQNELSIKNNNIYIPFITKLKEIFNINSQNENETINTLTEKITQLKNNNNDLQKEIITLKDSFNTIKVKFEQIEKNAKNNDKNYVNNATKIPVPLNNKNNTNNFKNNNYDLVRTPKVRHINLHYMMDNSILNNNDNYFNKSFKNYCLNEPVTPTINKRNEYNNISNNIINTNLNNTTKNYVEKNNNIKSKCLTDAIDINKYKFQRNADVTQQCINSKNSLDDLMTNIKNLENILKNPH